MKMVGHEAGGKEIDGSPLSLVEERVPNELAFPRSEGPCFGQCAEDDVKDVVSVSVCGGLETVAVRVGNEIRHSGAW